MYKKKFSKIKKQILKIINIYDAQTKQYNNNWVSAIKNWRFLIQN